MRVFGQGKGKVWQARSVIYSDKIIYTRCTSGNAHDTHLHLGSWGPPGLLPQKLQQVLENRRFFRSWLVAHACRVPITILLRGRVIGEWQLRSGVDQPKSVWDASRSAAR